MYQAKLGQPWLTTYERGRSTNYMNIANTYYGPKNGHDMLIGLYLVNNFQTIANIQI